MSLTSLSQGPFIKGVVASNQPLAQPKGAIARGSNLILTARGALTPCDGSGIIDAFNGAVQNNQGKMIGVTLFDPTSVTPYYLALKQITSLRLGAPRNLTIADGGAGGTLAAGTYFYKVTAIDGTGGETTVSNEVTITILVNHKITLTWNVVPNAFGYNVYRSATTNTEILMTGPGLPVLQVPAGTTSVTFSDNGTATPVAAISIPIVSITENNIGNSAVIVLSSPVSIAAFQPFAITGNTQAAFNHSNLTVVNPVSGTTFSFPIAAPPFVVGTGGNLGTGAVAPPLSDTTGQTALYQMPLVGASYNDSNIVALFPATVPALNTAPSGGSGGAGMNGSGSGGLANSTPNGGIPGMLSLLPQFKQFTNRMVIALGNGFAPQIFSDATGTTVNPAFIGIISAISVDAFGVVTITTTLPHGIDPTQGVGANVVVAGVAVLPYNGTFVTIAIPGANSVQVRNLAAIGSAPSSGGTMTVTTIPIISTFTPAYPVWAASQTLVSGDIIAPATQPSPPIYLTVIQGGITGAVEPTWPTGGTASIGKHIQEASPGTVIYTVSGLLNTAAPPPPGASHIEVYSGALWVFNTSPTNTANGLDGPCSLRQSSINNPNSWNPVNQAFLDKDDGSEGMGLAKFTITAQGIPPQGSLIAFKNWSPYQIIGVFGAPNLAIQAVSSDMGCIAPRTILFVPGFGIVRYSHLGVSKFDGVKDEIISEQIRPYLFPSAARNFSDITVLDATWVAISWAALTANPPMYALGMPIGNSFGALRRLFPYDLVLKAWDVIDLPFSISSMAQVRSTVSNPITIFGGYLDGVLQRWQAGDLQWYTGGGASAQNVNWSFRSLTVASNDTDQRVYARKLVLTGTNTGPQGFIGVSINLSGVPQSTQRFLIPANSDFDIDVPVQLTGKRVDAVVFSVTRGPVPRPLGAVNFEIDGCTWELEPRPAGVVVPV